jgi:hypothetical protein
MTNISAGAMIKSSMEAMWNSREVFPNHLRAYRSRGRKVSEPPDREANKRLNRARKAFEAWKHLYGARP